MANGVNKVILIGNLGRDPEVQTFDNDLKKATISVATTEVYRGRDGGKEQHTEWHRVILWRRLAEIAESYLRKGNQVYIEGRIRTRQYDDKDGITKYITEIEGQNLTMLGGRDSSNGAPPAPQQVPDDKPVNKEDVKEDIEDESDDLPF